MMTDEIILSSDIHSIPVLKMYHSTAMPGKRTYQEHHHTQLEISAVLSGVCEWQIRRRPFRCRAGDIVILGSDEEHYITSIDPGEPLQLLNLQFEPRYIWSPGNSSFDSDYLSIFLNHEDLFQNVLSGGRETAKEVFSLLGRMYAEGRDRKPEYGQIVKAQLMLILGLLGREYSAVITAGRERDSVQLDRIDRAMSYINENITGELTLEEIARQASLSRSYFSTAFKKLNGVSVWSYITGKRIELAMSLLRGTEKTVLDIAGECGFNNLANFNRSFRMITGLAPSEYRKSV